MTMQSILTSRFAELVLRVILDNDRFDTVPICTIPNCGILEPGHERGRGGRGRRRGRERGRERERLRPPLNVKKRQHEKNKRGRIEEQEAT